MIGLLFIHNVSLVSISLLIFILFMCLVIFEMILLNVCNICVVGTFV